MQTNECEHSRTVSGLLKIDLFEYKDSESLRNSPTIKQTNNCQVQD